MEDTQALVLDSPSKPVLETLNSEEKHQWRMTGNLPEAKKEAAPPSPPPVEEKTQASSETKPDAEAGKQESKRENRNEERFRTLTEHNRALKAKVEQLEAKWASGGDNGDKRTDAPSEKQAPKLEMPLIDQYDDLGKYNSDLRDYFEKLSESKASEILAKKELERRQADEKKKVEDAQKSIQARFEERTKEAEKKYPDLKEKIFSDEFRSKVGDVVAGYVLARDLGHDVAYHLASNPDELDRIQELDPFSQAVELTKIELSLADGTKDEAKPAKKAEIPPPPRVLGTGATPPKDAIESALQKGDFSTYKRLANQRDAERLKGRR